jgi:acetolactate synthase regulatory subunit
MLRKVFTLERLGRHRAARKLNRVLAVVRHRLGYPVTSALDEVSIEHKSIK